MCVCMFKNIITMMMRSSNKIIIMIRRLQESGALNVSSNATKLHSWNANKSTLSVWHLAERFQESWVWSNPVKYPIHCPQTFTHQHANKSFVYAWHLADNPGASSLQQQIHKNTPYFASNFTLFEPADPTTMYNLTWPYRSVCAQCYQPNLC